MEAKQKEYGTEIFLISDEPYRELAYDGVEVPYLTKYYDNTIVGYSFSKSLSLPGERIGSLVIPDEVADSEDSSFRCQCGNKNLRFCKCTNSAAESSRKMPGCKDRPFFLQQKQRRSI